MAKKEIEQTKVVAGDSRTALVDVYRSIVDLAQQENDKRTYYKKALGLVIQPFSCPYANLYIHMASEVIEEYQHSGPTSPDFWKPAVRSFLHDSLVEKKPGLKTKRRKYL